MTPMIRLCDDADFDTIRDIINDAAPAYEGVIPAARWHEPYMSVAELREEISGRGQFWGYDQAGRLNRVMGV